MKAPYPAEEVNEFQGRWWRRRSRRYIEVCKRFLYLLFYDLLNCHILLARFLSILVGIQMALLLEYLLTRLARVVDHLIYTT